MRARSGITIPLLLLAVTNVSALTDEEIFRNFRFNMINPGARSLALGGAFVSLADDATAAQANPAGLSFLLKPEYFAEYRWVDNGGTASVVRQSLPTNVDAFVATQTNLEDYGSPSFLSAVFPVGKWTLGVSLQVVLQKRNATLNAFAFTFPDQPGTFLANGSGFIDVQSVNYNASAGYRLSDRLSVGGSIAYSTLDVDSQVISTIMDTGGAVAGTPLLEPYLDLLTRINASDYAFGGNVGVIYRYSDQYSFAAVYRRAPKFSVPEALVPEADLNGNGTVEDTEKALDIFGVQDRLGDSFPNQFNLPDSYGVSAAWNPTPRFTFVQDFERVLYSQLVDGYVAGVNILTSPDAKFTVDDAWQYHAGAEYVLTGGKTPIALRAGLWTESDNTIRAVSTGTNSFSTPAAFPGSDPQVHGTAGVGFVWRHGQFKLDLAMDLSNAYNQYLFSFIVRQR